MIDECYANINDKLLEMLSDWIYDCDSNFDYASFQAKVFRAILRRLGFNEFLEEMNDDVCDNFCPALKTIGIDVDFIDFEVCMPESYGAEFIDDFRSQVNKELQRLPDKIVKEISDRMVYRITSEYGFPIESEEDKEDLYCAVEDCFEGELAYIKISGALNEVVEKYMEQTLPSALSIYIGKAETDDGTVTYFYNGPSRMDNGNGMYSLSSLECFSLLFFLPLIIEQQKLKSQKTENGASDEKSSGALFLCRKTRFAQYTFEQSKLRIALIIIVF